MKPTDFFGTIIAAVCILLGYMYHESRVHPSAGPPWYSAFDAPCMPSVSAIKVGETYLCGRGSTLSLQNATNGILAVCTCPAKP
jgi:hypothetical protein